MTATLADTTYNGWANYETWNVALWMQNDEGLYTLARHARSYHDFVQQISWCRTQTPDGVRYDSMMIDHEELNEMMQDL